MPDSSQEQQFGNVDLTNGKLTSVNAGGDAIVDSPGAQIIQESYWSLFGGKPKQSGIDWDWAMQILKQQQPDIKKRLKDSLFGLAEVDAVEVESKRQEESPALALEAKKLLTVNGTDAGTIDPQAPIIATYARADVDGSLLILGTPGAGKTITLLKLAEQLVGEAIVQPQTVIPIIFELSTWQDGQNIEAWLIEQLYENYGGNRKRKIYETWVERRVLLPLLDGLDELGMVRQKACTEKVNEFAAQYRRVVVCCRVKEFQQAGVNLSNLRGKVQLQPLSDRQLERYLEQMGKDGLWEQIRSVPEMGKLLESVIDKENADYDEPGLLRVPLFISLAAQVYEQDKPLKGKADLFERYIDRQLSFDVREGDRRKELGRRQWAFETVEAETGWRETRHSLGWVARQLQQRNQVELLIEKIQPSWLESDQAKWQYRLIGSLIIGLISSLIASLIGSLVGDINFMLIFGLAVGLGSSLIVGLGNSLDVIEPIESFRRVSISHEVRRDFFKIFRNYLIVGLIGGPIIGLISILISNITFGMIFGLTSGLIIGLTFGLTLGLIGSLKEDLKVKFKPNQGIWNSCQNAFWTIILSYPIGVILIAGVTSLPLGIAVAITAGKSWIFIIGIIHKSIIKSMLIGTVGSLIFGLMGGGGAAVIEHFCLRIILTRYHKLPWNLARFLTYCHERRLLQQIGGRYRFIHRELLEHFARIENVEVRIARD